MVNKTQSPTRREVLTVLGSAGFFATAAIISTKVDSEAVLKQSEEERKQIEEERKQIEEEEKRIEEEEQLRIKNLLEHWKNGGYLILKDRTGVIFGKKTATIVEFNSNFYVILLSDGTASPISDFEIIDVKEVK